MSYVYLERCESMGRRVARAWEAVPAFNLRRGGARYLRIVNACRRRVQRWIAAGKLTEQEATSAWKRGHDSVYP